MVPSVDGGEGFGAQPTADERRDAVEEPHQIGADAVLAAHQVLPLLLLHPHVLGAPEDETERPKK